MMKQLTFIEENKKKYLLESNPTAQTFKSQVKIHKEGKPIRPIVSFINAPIYKLSKEVSRVLKEKYEFGTKYNIENNVKLIEKLENIRINVNTKLISLDVKDMFTNIIVNKVIKLSLIHI